VKHDELAAQFLFAGIFEMKKEAKILIADDEADVLDFISYNFQREGYVTVLAKDGIEAINVARREKPDLLLLDVMMPRLDGFAVAEHIRSSSDLKNTLIVFLTALTDEDAELKGFSAGADDFITKPIKPRLLLSRVNALLRRRFESNQAGDRMELGGLLIDKERREVKLHQQLIGLARKEFDLLALLCSKPGRVFPRQEILNSIWNEEAMIGDRTIDVHIRKIRKKIGEESIKTVKGVGYKFEL
jgi:two-component system alkaline phosphatase synthesis response regulator PhoP